MNGKEYLDELERVKEDVEMIEKVENTYKVSLPKELRKIVSNANETVFLDGEKRILSIDEIQNADEELHVGFIDKSLLPIADFCENNFLVFQISKNKWAKYNIIDNTIFKERDTIDELLI